MVCHASLYVRKNVVAPPYYVALSLDIDLVMLLIKT